MKKLLLCISLFIGITSFSQMTMNGTATSYGPGCNEYRLTQEVTGQAGAIWSPNTIDLSNNFDMEFEVYFGNGDIWAADGMGFVLQENPSGLGSSGNGLGYAFPYPVPISSNNLIVEFDLFDNGGAVPTDISADHVAVSSNGSQHHDLVSATQFPSTQEISDGAYHTVRLQWDAGFQTLALFWQGSPIPLITYTADIVNTIFAGNSNVYWGWTAGTGGVVAETRVQVTSSASFTQDLSSVCPGLPVQFIDASTSTLNYFDAWAWDFGDGSPLNFTQNPTHSYSAPGSYTVTLTAQDGFGCQYVANSSVTVLDSINLTMSSTDVSCFGDTDGTGTGLPTSGSSPYTYAWNDSGTQSTQTASALAPGTYTVTVTDNLGCVGIDSVSINEPAEILLTMDSSNVACATESTGWASVDVTNGVSPFTYLWDDPSTQTTDTATALPAGMYSVTVTDVNGCTASDAITITEPSSPLSATATSTPDNGTMNGTIDLTPSGGVPPYTFVWDNGPTTEDQSGLATGTYTVSITDSVGCVFNLPVTVGSSIGFESLSDIGFSVFPNPTNGQFTVNGIGEYQLIVLDVQGRVIYSTYTTENTLVELDVESGVYLVKVLKDKGEFIDKLIVK